MSERHELGRRATAATGVPVRVVTPPPGHVLGLPAGSDGINVELSGSEKARFGWQETWDPRWWQARGFER